MALVSLPVDIVANGGPDWSVDGPALVSFKGYGDSSKGLPAVLFRGYGNSSKGLQLSFSGVKAKAAKAFQQSFSGVIITAKSYSCPFHGLRRLQPGMGIRSLVFLCESSFFQCERAIRPFQRASLFFKEQKERKNEFPTLIASKAF